MGRECSYGFRVAPNRVHVESEPTEQNIIERMSRLREQGKSLRAIASDLNRKRCKTQQGSKWRHEYVAKS
jgi:Recombinase